MKIIIPFTGRRITRLLMAVFLLFVSCEQFFDPDQGLIIDENEYFQDWNEFRAAELGLYALQQELVSQLLVLGELRGDLLTTTENADRNLLEVNLHQLTLGNKYGTPLHFYRLIGACNRLATRLEQDHPEVLQNTTPNIYDRLYGEVLCMRAWAYFNAVRIFKEVPYIWPSLTTVEEIREYVSQSKTIINPVTIIYGQDGYHDNDTIYGDTIHLERMYLDITAIVDTFTRQLTEDVKIVGVIHNLVNGDPTWDVTIWNHFAKSCLLGQMYLEVGNYSEAVRYFDQILRFENYNLAEGSNVRYGLDRKFSYYNWKNIFTAVDIDEHIMTIWFNKSYQQQNDLQNLFSTQAPNRYMLKPTSRAIRKWETVWRDYNRIEGNKPEETHLDPEQPGYAGDFSRGYNVSYTYQRNGINLEPGEVARMLELKRQKNETAVREIMRGVDTIAYKFTVGKNSFDRDANFSIYRAAGIHLYYAEIYARWIFLDPNGVPRPDVFQSLNVLNDGSYNYDGRQLGVRGRVGFGTGIEAISLTDPIYVHDPETNEVTGYLDYAGNLFAKQIYLEDRVMDERIRELAFEGERFYDLMRLARRRQDPSYLADRVAAKFDPPLREQIRQHLLDEENWYLKLE